MPRPATSTTPERAAGVPAPGAVASFADAVRADPHLATELYRRRSPAEKARLVAAIATAHARARRLMRRGDVRTVVDALRGSAGPGPSSAGLAAAEHVQAQRMGWAVRRLAPLLPGDTRCLAQSLTLMSVLARRGIGSTLIIGVAPGGVDAGDFAAHAWLEHGGEPLLPRGEALFDRLVAL